jgi:pyruvate formate lyase activating enzyme
LIEEGLIDYVAMDIKVDEAQWFSLLQKKEKIHPYMQSIQLLIQGSIEYEFRTTLIKPYHTHESFTNILSYIA